MILSFVSYITLFVAGIFSLPEPTTIAQSSAAPGDSMSINPARVPQEGVEIVGRLKERIIELEERVKELEAQLEEKEEMKCVLEGDLENLKKEVRNHMKRGWIWSINVLLKMDNTVCNCINTEP